MWGGGWGGGVLRSMFVTRHSHGIEVCCYQSLLSYPKLKDTNNLVKAKSNRQRKKLNKWPLYNLWQVIVALTMS